MNDQIAARTGGLNVTYAEFEEALWRRHYASRSISVGEREARIQELIAAYLAEGELEDALQALAVELVLYRNDMLTTPIAFDLTEKNPEKD